MNERKEKRNQINISEIRESRKFVSKCKWLEKKILKNFHITDYKVIESLVICVLLVD